MLVPVTTVHGSCGGLPRRRRILRRGYLEHHPYAQTAFARAANAGHKPHPAVRPTARSCWKIAELKADLNVDEAEKAFGVLVIPRGNAAFFSLLKHRSTSVDGHPELSSFAHRNALQHIAHFHGLADMVRVVAAVPEQDARLRQVVGYYQIEAKVIRCLPRRDLGSHGQTCRINTQVDLGREPTS